MATVKANLRLSSNFGDLLVESARNTLLSHYDIKGALSTLTDGIGCDEEQAIQLLEGKMFLVLCDNGIDLDGVMYDKEVHTDRVLYDFNTWCRNVYHEIRDDFKAYKFKLNDISTYLADATNRGINIHISNSEAIQATISNAPIVKDIREDVLSQMSSSFGEDFCSIISTIEDYVSDNLPAAEVANWLVDTMTYRSIEPLYKTAKELLLDLREYCLILKNGNTLQVDKTLEIELERKIKHTETIKESVDRGLEPVDIRGNWDAGWLSPEGVYYALNGAVSNRLHNNIADGLVKIGVVPTSETNNPDAWLEKNGWAKLHGRHILYSGWMLFLDGLDVIPMTEIQKSKICDYGNACHDGLLELGFNKEEVRVSRIAMTEILMMRQYFI